MIKRYLGELPMCFIREIFMVRYVCAYSKLDIRRAVREAQQDFISVLSFLGIRARTYDDQIRVHTCKKKKKIG